MIQSPLKLRASRKNIAILVLALSVGAPALAASYNFRVAAQGLKPSAAVVPSGPTISQLNFSSCGQGGRTGPTLTMCQTAYSAQAALLTSLAMPGYQGYQEWTVPATGNYTITAAGAGGGTTPQSGVVGGRGAILKGTFNLTVGTVLQIVVGQAGITAQAVSQGVSYTDAGGGGGTFVVNKAGNTPLLVAGGGGGANYYSSGQYYGSGGDGATATAAPAPPTSVNENSGVINYGEPGGGFSADGALPGWGSATFTVAQGFNSGAVGGISTKGDGNHTANRFGGFGGGAGSHGYNCIGGGAGGGYSGGIGSAGCGGGGGGSSFIAGTATNKASSNSTYNGVSLGTTALGFVPVLTAGYVTIVQN